MQGCQLLRIAWREKPNEYQYFAPVKLCSFEFNKKKKKRKKEKKRKEDYVRFSYFYLCTFVCGKFMFSAFHGRDVCDVGDFIC